MTIKARIILADTAIFGLILLAVAFVVYDRARESEIAKLDSRLDVFAASFITEFEDEWENHEFPENGELQAIGAPGFPGVRVNISDASGKVVFSRGTLPPLDSAHLRWALGNNPTFETIHVHDSAFRQLIRPTETDEEAGFILRVAAPMAEVYSRLHDLALILATAVPAALFLSALLVYIITRLAFKPMTQMVEAAENISASSLHRRIAVPPRSDEVRRLADALNEMMNRIEDAFNSQRQFVADASHELRTPLTVVYSELEYVRRNLADEKSREGIDEALSETERLSRLIDQLLLLARIDARKLILDLQPVRLDELLAETAKLLRGPSEAADIRFELHIEEAVEMVGDAGKLKQAFLNVVENAVKYSPRGGRITTSLKTTDNTAIIMIADQGPGIAPADMPNVFRRFHRGSRARAEREGSGLGLAIAKELVEAHGGHIDIASEPGAGTTVTINLPLNTPRPNDLE